jgi:hypothetical protein
LRRVSNAKRRSQHGATSSSNYRGALCLRRDCGSERRSAKHPHARAFSITLNLWRQGLCRVRHEYSSPVKYFGSRGALANRRLNLRTTARMPSSRGLKLEPKKCNDDRKPPCATVDINHAPISSRSPGTDGRSRKGGIPFCPDLSRCRCPLSRAASSCPEIHK